MRRPSPALVVAVAACVIACAGSATAASLITGAQIANDSVTGIDIHNHSLRGKDIGTNTVTGRNVAGITGRDVLTNGLDGSDIDESTFEAVPEATRAKTAATATTATTAQTAASLTHARVQRLATSQAPGSGSAVAYDEGGLRIQAECTAAG